MLKLSVRHPLLLSTAIAMGAVLFSLGAAFASVPDDLAQAAQAWQAGNQGVACGAYLRVLATDPTHTEALYGKALCLQQAQPVKAIALLQQLVSNHPNHGPAWLLLGELHEQQGHEAQAIDAYRHYVGLGGPLPKSPSFRLRLKQWGLI